MRLLKARISTTIEVGTTNFNHPNVSSFNYPSNPNKINKYIAFETIMINAPLIK